LERCERLSLNLKFARKSVHVKTKPFNRQTVFLFQLNKLFKVLSTGTNTSPQPWPPLINGLVDDALLELSSAFNILQDSVATWRRYLGEVGKFLL